MRYTILLIASLWACLQAQVPSNGLIAYYSFTGNALDSSGNSNNGTVSGATLTSDRFGQANSAYYFNGISSMISAPYNSSMNIAGSFSISLFFKYQGKGTPQKGYWTLINRDGGEYGWQDPYHIYMMADSAGTLKRGMIVARCATGNSALGDREIHSKDTLNDGQWHNITLVYETGLRYSLYIDSHLDTATSVPANWIVANDASPLTIGVWPAYSSYFNGSIDDIRLYNKALTASEVYAIYDPITLPGTPAIISPAVNAVNVPVSPTLTWNPVSGAYFYEVLISTSIGFSSVLKDTSGIIGTSVSLKGLSNNTKYYWCVKAVNAGGSSAWSVTAYFTTILGLPSKVIPISPANAGHVSTDSVALMWHKVPYASNYLIQAATDSQMTHLLVMDTITDTTFMLRSMDNKQAYWWQVKAYNLAGWGEASQKMNFAYTAVVPVSTRNSNFSNYNFSSRSIQYTLKNAGFVSLAYFDVAGRLIFSLENKIENPGTHVLEVPKLPRGFYTQVFKAGDFMKISKMVLVK